MRLSSIFIFGSVFFLWGTPAYAHVPVLVEQESIQVITQISDPELSQAFYGEMKGYPHTYEIRTGEPFSLYAEILVPDIEESQNIISGIIIKEQKKGGRVTEVTRLYAKDAPWESQFEFFGGDTYRHGPRYEAEAEAGVYRIEVHTPENMGKYVLVVGSREEMTIGYFELLGRMMEIKTFFGKSRIMIIQSPLVYIPLIIIGGGVLFWYVRRRKLNAV